MHVYGSCKDTSQDPGKGGFYSAQHDLFVQPGRQVLEEQSPQRGATRRQLWQDAVRLLQVRADPVDVLAQLLGHGLYLVVVIDMLTRAHTQTQNGQH